MKPRPKLNRPAFLQRTSQNRQAPGGGAALLEQFGRLDAIVHCAGLAPILKIEETTDQQWHDVIDTSLSAAFYLARAAWPAFVKQKGGVIVNISSLAARDPFVGFAAYGAAKAGMNLLGLALREKVSRTGFACILLLQARRRRRCFESS